MRLVMLRKLDQFCKTYFPDDVIEPQAKRLCTRNSDVNIQKAVTAKAYYTMLKSTREGLSEERLCNRVKKVESIIATLEAEKLSPESIQQFKKALNNIRERYYKAAFNVKDLQYSYSQDQIDRFIKNSGLSLIQLYHESRKQIHIIPIKIDELTLYYNLKDIISSEVYKTTLIVERAKNLYSNDSNSTVIDLSELPNLTLEFPESSDAKFLELKLLREKLYHFKEVSISSFSVPDDDFKCECDIDNLPDALRVPHSGISKLESLTVIEPANMSMPYQIPPGTFKQLKQHPNLRQLHLGYLLNDFKDVSKDPLESVKDVALFTTNKTVKYQTIAKIFPNAVNMTLGFAADVRFSDLDAVLSLPHLQVLTLCNTTGFQYKNEEEIDVQDIPKLDFRGVNLPNHLQRLTIECNHSILLSNGDRHRSKLSKDLFEQVMNLAKTYPHVVIELKNLSDLSVTEFREMCPNIAIDDLDIVQNADDEIREDDTDIYQPLDWHLTFSEGKIKATTNDKWSD